MACLLFAVFMTLICVENLSVNAQEIPRFLVEPSDTNVVELESTEISCSATGVPIPTIVSWMKDGVHIVLDGTKSILPSGALRITNARKSDDGYYHCVARNILASTISRRAKLNVAYFEQVFTTPQYRTRNAGTGFIESGPLVSINPLPKPIYVWKKNGVVLVEDGRISVSRDHALYIADLQYADGGTYTCEVENPVMAKRGKLAAKQIAGRYVLTISAAVPTSSATSLMLNPKDVTALQGVDLTIAMECFANKSGTLITWRKNGLSLIASSKYRFDSTRKRLTINTPSKSDAGQYSCESSTSNSRVTGSGTLRVIAPPFFRTKKMVIDAFSDNSTRMWCNATGSSSFNLKWYHNSKRVYQTGTRIRINSDRSLSVFNLSWHDAGVYQCIAQNTAGQAITLTQLNVNNITAKFTRPLRDSYFHVGSTAVIPCYVTGSPKPTIKWLRNGLAIPPSMLHISQTSKGYLQIVSSRKADSGRFTCVATNGAGSASATAYVGIVDPTVITKGPNTTTIAQRAITLWLPCEVRHDPTVNITREWRKNKGRLYDSRYSVLQDGRLQILSTQGSDAATFSCNVFSNGGNASVSTVLKIVSLPLSPSTPLASEISTNTLTLTWLAPEFNGGIVLKDYELQMKNETGNVFVTIMFTTQLRVQIKNLLAGMKYSFRVAARNELGRGRWSGDTPWIPMKILAPSRAPTNLHTSLTERTKIVLRWTPPPVEFHNGRLRGYNVYYRGRGYINSAFTIRIAPPGLITDKIITYSLDNLLTFTQYEIKVAAFNDAGVGVRTSLIYVETKPGIPSVAPTNVSIDVVNATAASVSYNSPRQIYWNGELIASRGYAYKPDNPLDVYTYDATYNRATRYNQTFMMMGLKPNTQYALRVAVVTASGAGPKSQPVYFRMQEGSPGSPRNFMVTSTFAHAIVLRWSAPYVTNGVLRGYKVGHRKYGYIGELWTERRDKEPPESGGAVYRGLLLNTRYEFYVLAFTNAGDGPKVFIDAQTRQTAPTLPGKPTKPILVENNGTSITLSWVMDETGGTIMSYYLIESNNQSNYHTLAEPFREWTLVVNLTRIQDIPTRIKNLTTNTIYRFRVTPVNSVGRGPTSNVSDDIRTAESKPTAWPTNLIATAHGRQALRIQWVPPPKYTWGSASISYKIKLVSIGKKDRDERTVHQRDSQSKEYIAGGLAKWTWFNVTVQVYNGVGSGPVSWPVKARTAEDVPDNGPATIRLVAVSNAVVNVTWTPVPAEIRNGLILGYNIYYNRKREPKIVHKKHITGGNTFASVLTGLAGYETYQIRMSAYTKTGEGKQTDPVEVVTPEGRAGKPYQVMFPVVRTDFVRVTWKLPLRPNGAILGYEVQYKLKDTADKFFTVQLPIAPSVRSADVGGLVGNRYYVFRVIAKTGRGPGEPAEELVLTTANRQVPESPVMLPIPLYDIEATTALVKWKPRDDGKSPIRYYTLQYNHQPDGWKDYLSNLTNRVDIDASLTQLRVTRLKPSSAYSFRIKATNDVGDSAWSQGSNTITTHPDAPKGAPTNLRIKPVPLIPTSLRIEWQAPSYEDLNGLPVEYIMRYREKGTTIWTPTKRLPKAPLYTQIDSLKVYTQYEISLAAINARGTGPWAQKTGITGESRPTGAPTNILLTVEGSNTIKIRWTPPPANTIHGNLLGYKIDYHKMGNVKKKRRRRRRSIRPSYCPPLTNPTKTKFSGPYVHEETIKNVERSSRYRITVRAYNGAGDGPKSVERDIMTREGPPGAPYIVWTKSYSDAIDVQWNVPCSPNGVITAYQVQFWQLGSPAIIKPDLKNYQFTYRIYGLKSLTNYKVQIRAATRMGYGDFASFTIKTRNSNIEFPGKPGKPVTLLVTDTSVVLKWKEGTDGNTPIEKYIIQYQKSDGGWTAGWEAKYYEWHRNNSMISFTIKKLEPGTKYSFRVISENKLGQSVASDATYGVITKNYKKPFHAELWFMILIIVVAVLIAALLILFICVRRRRQKSEYSSGLSTRERQLQQQSRDLKQQQAKQERPISAFLSAYGGDGAEEAKEETTKEELEKEADKRTRSDTLPMKDLEKMMKKGGTGTMRDRKNRLEKLDLQPVAFQVPTAPNDAPRKGEDERKAPEGEENRKDRRRSATMKQFERGSHDVLSSYSESEKKRSTSDEYSTSSDESIDRSNSRETRPRSLTGNARYSNTNIDRNTPGEIESSLKQENRKSPTREERPRRPLSSFTNPNYGEWDRHDGPVEKRHIAPISRDADFVAREPERETPTRASRSFDDDRRDMKGSRERIHSPEYGSISLQDEIVSRKASLKKSLPPKSHERDSREIKGYKSENDISDRHCRELRDEKGSRERIPSLQEEILYRRASLKKSHSTIDNERDYREIHGYKSQNDISDRHSREWEHTPRERRSVEGETNVPRNLKRHSQNLSSLKQNKSRIESDEEVFSSDFSPDRKSRSSDQNTDGLRKRSPRSESHDRMSDPSNHPRSGNSRSNDRGSDHSNHRSPRSKAHDRGSDHPNHSRSDNNRSYDRGSEHSNHRSPRSKAHDRGSDHPSHSRSDNNQSHDRGSEYSNHRSPRSKAHDRVSDHPTHSRSDNSQSHDRGSEYSNYRSLRSKAHDQGSDHPNHSRSDNSRSHNRRSDHYNHSRSENSQRHSYSGNEWDLDVDDYSERVPPVIHNRNDDYDDEYRKLVKDLTRGRSSTSYEDGGREEENRGSKRRSKSQREAVQAKENNHGLSSFEMAMVRNRGGSAQRLIDSETESVARSSKSLASQASKKPRNNIDKRPTKEDDRSSSSIAKNSDVSDNDADKSGEESDEGGKFIRGEAGATSIASHYANDPFYKNWRNSLDKKTRKAILTEYHDRHKKPGVRESMESMGSSRPYRSASEEGLDRITRPRVRPGRADLSEKRKLTQSDPYLNQEPAPSVSSFSPSEGEGRPRGKRPGRRQIDRAAARSEPSLNAHDSASDSENRFPPPYDDEGKRRKNSFLRATKGSEQSLKKGSLDNLDDASDASRAKKDLAAELDRAANFYTRAPPPYEEDADYEIDVRSPPAYTPRQDSSDDSRSHGGYNRATRNWRPQRQNGDRREAASPHNLESRVVPNRRSDEYDGPTNRTSMTLV